MVDVADGRVDGRVGKVSMPSGLMTRASDHENVQTGPVARATSASADVAVAHASIDIVALALSWAHAALMLLGCMPNVASAPRRKRKASYVIHTKWSESPEIVEAQLAFRRARFDRQKKVAKWSSMAISEGVEDRLRWLRIAAVLLLQTYVRSRRAADTDAPRAPAYLRPDWQPPTAREFEERVVNLQERVELSGVARSVIEESLHAHRGHAGYAATALIRGAGSA